MRRRCLISKGLRLAVPAQLFLSMIVHADMLRMSRPDGTAPISVMSDHTMSKGG